MKDFFILSVTLNIFLFALFRLKHGIHPSDVIRIILFIYQIDPNLSSKF